MKRITATVLGRGVAGTRRVTLGLCVMLRETPTAECAALLPQRIGAENGQNDGHHDAPLKREREREKRVRWVKGRAVCGG